MSIKNIKPTGNRVLVKRAQSKTTKGSILLPDSAQEKQILGQIIAAGPGKMNEKGVVAPMHVKVGDQVMFSPFAGSEVKSDEEGVEYLIMSEDDLFGILV